MENQVNPNIENNPSVDRTPIVPSVGQTQPKMNFLPIIITAMVCAVLFGLGGYFFGKQSYNTFLKTDFTQNQPEASSTPLCIPTSSPSLPSSNENHLTSWGYQNNEMGFSIEYPSSWSTSEENYIGNAKGLLISNKELDIAINIVYLKKGLEGQTGPSGIGNDFVNKGSFVLAGKSLDRTYGIYKGEKGIDTIETVYYFDPSKDRGFEFFLDNLQFTISVIRYMDENYHSGKPLTLERIQKAEQILSTFKIIK